MTTNPVIASNENLNRIYFSFSSIRIRSRCNIAPSRCNSQATVPGHKILVLQGFREQQVERARSPLRLITQF